MRILCPVPVINSSPLFLVSDTRIQQHSPRRLKSCQLYNPNSRILARIKRHTYGQFSLKDVIQGTWNSNWEVVVRKTPVEVTRLSDAHLPPWIKDWIMSQEITDSPPFSTNEFETRKKGIECTICMGTVNSEEAHVLPCGHVFHAECNNKWIRKQCAETSTCANCRALIF